MPQDRTPLILLGKRIRERRLELELSQERFAESCGVHRTYVWQIEAGRHNLALLNLIRIATALDMTASQLLDGIA